MDCIMLAAGIGRRTELGYPKQLMMLAGKPVLIHSMELFDSRGDIDNIIVTAIPDDDCIKRYEYLFKQYGIKKARVIPGGKTRQESVRFALEYVKSEYVVIHEAVRPFIEKDFLDVLLAAQCNAIVPVIDIPFTVVDVKNGLIPAAFYKSCELQNVQLPQKFKADMLLFAHQTGINEEFSDDSSLVYEVCGNEITYIAGSEFNIKITTPLDVKIAEVIYEEFSSSHRRQ